jgi:hypothetical protein
MKTIDLNLLTMAGLVDLYQELTGKSIKKFDSKAKGIARLEKLIAELPDEAPEAEEVQAEEEAPAAKPKSKKTPGRTAQVVEIIRSRPASVNFLVEHFGTSYKNITGDLYLIRNRGEKFGLASDEVLKQTRDGATRLYSVQKAGRA